MTVLKQDSVRDILYLQDRMNRVFEESMLERGNTAGEWMPYVDIYENAESLVIKIELPGVSREDVQLDVHDGILSLSGTKSFNNGGRGANYHMVERQYGNFRRSFNLPESIDDERIAANFDKGVLTITLPKVQQSLSRRIAINKA
jgi:HSP20 family protein